jgi:hypothetical protein
MKTRNDCRRFAVVLKDFRFKAEIGVADSWEYYKIGKLDSRK